MAGRQFTGYGTLRIPARPPAGYQKPMFKQGEFQPETAVPVTGRYELYHVLGRRTGVCADFVVGQVLPAAPRGWFWSLMSTDANDPGCADALMEQAIQL